ncbi:aldose epimerase family protein [Maribacter forsetii]|uniref:aldose epimerase family protein n=1 Tax=Maribacter forsetii TaxID=444515 RepID=UPI00056B1B5E|nr:aldose epimerase family protein [Maribacter forsetii]
MRLAKLNSFSINIFIILMLCLACKKKIDHKSLKKQKSVMRIEKCYYGTTVDKEEVTLFKLINEGGIYVEVITFGGRVTTIKCPDLQGKMDNVVLGFDSLSQYEKKNPYFGAAVGRYVNRIANGRFSLEGEVYTLAKNNGDNSLHGGLKGFDKVVWIVEEVKETPSFVSVKLAYLSKDMEEGFPGNLQTTVTYTLNNDNSLNIHYEAITDKTTIVNLTNHSYFNLSGDCSNSILDHEVQINANKYVPVNKSLIPTGTLASVEHTPFDFRAAQLLGDVIKNNHEQIEIGDGFDHCWVLNNVSKGYRSVAKAYHSLSGRVLEVLTDQPGMQFYTGNFLDGTLPAPNGGVFNKRSGFCFETQHFPDAPNQPKFPSTTLVPGEKYRTKTTFKFSTKY